MTAQTLAPVSDARELAEQRLESLVAAHLNGHWTIQHDADLFALALPVLSVEDVVVLFEELCENVRLRDGVDEGIIHWTEVDDSLTRSEPSAVAYDLACGWVDDATTSLIGGRR